jgi:tetratricopeptide (TPR) repeat protein
LALSPSSTLALGISATLHSWAGEEATAIEHAELALRLSPLASENHRSHHALAYAHFFAGRFEAAAVAASRSAQARPQFSFPWLLRTAALTSLGRMAEAQTSAGRLLELWPDFTIGRLREMKFTSPERVAMLAEALRKAGLPEE